MWSTAGIPRRILILFLTQEDCPILKIFDKDNAYYEKFRSDQYTLMNGYIT